MGLISTGMKGWNFMHFCKNQWFLQLVGMKEYWAVEIHEFPNLQNRKWLISRITMVMAWYIYLQYFLYFLVLYFFFF